VSRADAQQAKLRDAPLGVFDSGLGGLTVVRALREHCPNEDIVYLGDNARVPYGTRSADTVVRYAQTCAGELAHRGVKAIVVACNTVSSVVLEMLRAELSGAYRRAVAALSTRSEVVGQAAPMLVALAEDGWLGGEVPRLVVRRYLEPFFGPETVPGLPRAATVGCVVLGCTHFPLFHGLIEDEMRELGGRGIPVVDSAVQTARDVHAFLEQRAMATTRARPGKLQVLVTDMPSSFEAVASRFLGDAIEQVEQVDLAVMQG
jgi:glutamate racemase